MFTCEEYFATQPEIVEQAIRVDGHYHGWISQRVMETYGLASSAAEAWESNGGGKYSFKLSSESISKAGKPQGWSDAKYVSYKMFKKNPNQYFYRHTEPALPQWTGDWSQEEQALFMDTVKKYGCGDKWGLFASHIPNRVGYQCSNYYRNVILPAGLVFDDTYRMTLGGSAVYVGPAGIREAQEDRERRMQQKDESASSKAPNP